MRSENEWTLLLTQVSKLSIECGEDKEIPIPTPTPNKTPTPTPNKTPTPTPNKTPTPIQPTPTPTPNKTPTPIQPTPTPTPNKTPTPTPNKTPTPIQPTPTPTPTPNETPTPTPSPALDELEWRWHTINGEETLQVKNILKPSNDNFSALDTSLWTTVYGFQFDPSTYKLDHNTWPDAAVASGYTNQFSSTFSFDGITFRFSDVKNDSVRGNYMTIIVDNFGANIGWSDDSITASNELFVYVGNINNENTANNKSSVWPTIIKIPTSTPTPTLTPTQALKDCCTGLIKIPTNGGIVDSLLELQYRDLKMVELFVCLH